ncbi:MAG: catalase-related domain-containing protein [Gallionella sp.]|nr:catalase-related domain-containing protein [Gallionella sp.]
MFRLMSADQKRQLVDNLVGAMKVVPGFIQVRQLKHFYKADPDYGKGVSAVLGVDLKEVV